MPEKQGKNTLLVRCYCLPISSWKSIGWVQDIFNGAGSLPGLGRLPKCPELAGFWIDGVSRVWYSHWSSSRCILGWLEPAQGRQNFKLKGFYVNCKFFKLDCVQRQTYRLLIHMRVSLNKLPQGCLVVRLGNHSGSCEEHATEFMGNPNGYESWQSSSAKIRLESGEKI